MQRLTFLFATIAAFAMLSCGGSFKYDSKDNDTISSSARAKGDSTLYGLACEGCTDSVLVFLSFDGGDPVTYDIIDAAKAKKIIGHPETGDWVGVVLNKDDKKKADMVIDLDQLKGTWVYQAMPVVRKQSSLGQTVESAEDKALRDSMLRSQMKPREQGFSLKRSSVAEPVGFIFKRDGEDDSPVVYPEVKFYTEWHVYNGKLLLKSDLSRFARNKKAPAVKAFTDTASFVFMTKDSLQLRFKDEVRNYYRKQ